MSEHPMGWVPRPGVDHRTHVHQPAGEEPRTASTVVPCPDRGLCPLTNAAVPHEHLQRPDGTHDVQVLEPGASAPCPGPPGCTLAAARVQHVHRVSDRGTVVDQVLEALDGDSL